MIWLGVVALIIAPALTRKCSVQIIATVFPEAVPLKQDHGGRKTKPTQVGFSSWPGYESSFNKPVQPRLLPSLRCQTPLFRQLLIDFSFASLDLGWL